VKSSTDIGLFHSKEITLIVAALQSRTTWDEMRRNLLDISLESAKTMVCCDRQRVYVSERSPHNTPMHTDRIKLFGESERLLAAGDWER
jgi:hypothetical protein